MIKLFKGLLVFGLAGFMGFGIYQELMKSDFSNLHRIKIDGASRETTRRLETLISHLMGAPFWKIDVNAVASLIRTDHWVDSVKVHRQLPNSLIVSVVERKPVAIVNNGRGALEFLDGANTVIDQAPAEQIADFPVLAGPDFTAKIDLRKRALDLLQELPDAGTLSRKDVSDLRYTEDHGFQITLQKTGIEIDIGKENIPLHLDRVRRVVQYLQDNNINATHIDSDYAKKVLVKVRKDR